MGRRVHLEQPIHEEALALLRENAEVSVGFGSGGASWTTHCWQR